jgi:hypothetical protein
MVRILLPLITTVPRLLPRWLSTNSIVSSMWMLRYSSTATRRPCSFRPSSLISTDIFESTSPNTFFIGKTIPLTICPNLGCKIIKVCSLLGIFKKRRTFKCCCKQSFSTNVQVHRAIIIVLGKNHRTTIYRTTIHLL